MNANQTPRLQQTLALAAKIAAELGTTYTGTEHVLLSMARLKSGSANRVLATAGLTEEAIREALKATEEEPTRDNMLRVLCDLGAALRELSTQVQEMRAELKKGQQ